jgi:hypothetical protein
MQIRPHHRDRYGNRRNGLAKLWYRFRLVRTTIALAAMLVVSSKSLTQSHIPHPNLPPEANRLPDANDQMRMNQQQVTRKNFDAMNAMREQQISDDTVKLLILAKDLKSQMDKLGDNPLPGRLVREAEVIELLARDVQKKMTLTVGGG